MLLLLLTGLFFLFISLSIGLYISSLLRVNSQGLLSIILTGTLILTVYLNILSVFFKSNYWLLVLPFILSVVIFSKGNYRLSFCEMWKQDSDVLLAKKNVITTAGVLTVIVLFTIVPPYNTDSSGYHFLAILWNEKFSAVPGLANLFPQYGYNSSFFLLSSAFAFTDIFHQSIYPVNAVLSAAFFLWLLKKSFAVNGYSKLIYWLMMFVLLRQFPINLASPSADNLASILVFYILFNLFEMDIKTAPLHAFNYLLLLAAFAIIIKLSTLPLMLVGLAPLISRRFGFKALIKNYLQVIILILLIILPWLIRNIILSGYLIFPFHSIDIFSFDWKVPANVTIAENLHITQGPRMISEDWTAVSKMPFIQWFPLWLPHVLQDNLFNFLLVVAGLLSPVLWVILFFRKIKIKMLSFFAYAIAYLGVWFWLLTSPDIRFGYHYLLPCILLPLLAVSSVIYNNAEAALSSKIFSRNSAFYKILTISILIYYSTIAIHFLQPCNLSGGLIKPFKSAEYYKNNDPGTFSYVMLNNNIKLYIHDSLHHSINAPLPSCYPFRRGIKMRTNKLQDGFKTQP